MREAFIARAIAAGMSVISHEKKGNKRSPTHCLINDNKSLVFCQRALRSILRIGCQRWKTLVKVANTEAPKSRGNAGKIESKKNY